MERPFNALCKELGTNHDDITGWGWLLLACWRVGGLLACWRAVSMQVVQDDTKKCVVDRYFGAER